jgi:hypothetical protein
MVDPAGPQSCSGSQSAPLAGMKIPRCNACGPEKLMGSAVAWKLGGTGPTSSPTRDGQSSRFTPSIERNISPHSIPAHSSAGPPSTRDRTKNPDPFSGQNNSMPTAPSGCPTTSQVSLTLQLRNYCRHVKGSTSLPAAKDPWTLNVVTTSSTLEEDPDRRSEACSPGDKTCCLLNPVDNLCEGSNWLCRRKGNTTRSVGRAHGAVGPT